MELIMRDLNTILSEVEAAFNELKRLRTSERVITVDLERYKMFVYGLIAMQDVIIEYAKENIDLTVFDLTADNATSELYEEVVSSMARDSTTRTLLCFVFDFINWEEILDKLC